MTKKRKVCSPSQEGQRDMCSELKEFIVSENAKCVKEIKDSNNRRIVALEESLSFALDSLTAVSERQRSADTDIIQLRKETAELRHRLQQLELGEDHQQQQKRLTCLVFSGPTLQAQSRREDAASLIRSLVLHHLKHSLDSSQVKAMIRLKNGKILIEFTSAAPGSDRDILFRTKSKLRGSGLFIAESLTPRRQAMFADLLQLKREGLIFSVFTRSGNILVCRSRDSAPIRIADPEAVRQLAGTGALGRSAQGRAQLPGGGGQPVLSVRREQGGPARETMPPTSASGDVLETEMSSPAGVLSPARHGSDPRPPRRDTGRGSVPPDSVGASSRRGREGSSLLDCALEMPVQLVQLSPPLGVESGAGAGCGGRDESPTVPESRGESTPADRRRPAEPLESPLMRTSTVDSPAPVAGENSDPHVTVTSAATSPVSAAAPAARESGDLVSERGQALSSGGQYTRRTEQMSVRGGAAGGVLRSGSGSGAGAGVGGRSVRRAADAGAALPGYVGSASGGASGVAGREHYRDIREYF